ncbi:hypothetical protein FE257_001658 [Aspergillus nanangensis]|uniref:Carrier domain-containing protein n=1 Tax=Aspergillus nanangensis TaxID=2582783 RepID=A0AAD4CTR5_ASPNN|nr:hypothetical protein FE257_001658 [Aspergillus nanangensis]
MAQRFPCHLPVVRPSPDGPKRPVSLRIETTSDQTSRLLSSWKLKDLEPLLQTVWALLLYRYTGSEDICFGYQHLGGDLISEIQPDSLSLYLFQFHIQEHESVQDVLKRAKADDAIPEKLENHDWLESDYDLCNTTLMVRICLDPAGSLHDNFVQPALAMMLPEEISNDDIGIFVEWWKDKVSTEHIKSLVFSFEKILSQVLLLAEDLAVKDLNIFSEPDWHRVSKFNAVSTESPDQCIHNVIYEQMLAHPDKEAVCAWDGSLTYQELDFFASQVATYLWGQGVRPETIVALCFDKSKWYIVAVLGVLKAGGAFVPLDPTHPTARLQSLAESVKAKIALCSRNRTETLRDVTKNLVPLDQDTFTELTPASEKFMILPEVKGCDAAYIMFTSGSTGEPKGTLIEHKSYVASSMAHAPRLQINCESRVLQFAAHTFDASLVDILTVLMRGACICIPSEEERLNDIVKAINDMGVNHASLTPSFVDFIDISHVPGLETLALVGEAMSQSNLEIWSKRTLINAFGPTESAVTAAINPNVTISSDVRDIGLPTGLKCWIVNPDDHDRLVPVGCVGRKDTQIKLHGQRIELGEIEDRLNSDPDIMHCLVTLPQTGYAKGRLVAVISLSDLDDRSGSNPGLLQLVSNPGQGLLVSTIRDRLSVRLPAYMIPSVWLCVERLPLLASRKLDRKATINWVSTMEHNPGIRSMTDSWDQKDATCFENVLEDQIATIWSRVLNIPKPHIGPKESFLSLGGDSIAAITCIGGFKKHGIAITVQDVLRSKSIKDLATRARPIEQPTHYEEIVEKPFDLSPIQKLHVMTRVEGQGHFNQSILARLNRGIEGSDLRRCIEILIDRHSMLRARLLDSGFERGFQQQITKDITGSYRWREHDTTCDQSIERARAESQSSINAFTGPMVAVDFFRDGRQSCLMSIVAHHFVVDIVSWRVILEDLESLLLDDQEAMLQNACLPFQIWCQLQAGQCQALAKEEDHEHSIPVTELAYWGVENDCITYGDMDCEGFEVNEETTRCLLTGCHKSLQTEPIDIFLAVILHSFRQTFTDRSLPIIYNEGHGREVWDSSIDISRTVGWFTVLHPILISEIVSDDLIETLVLVKDFRQRVSDNGREDFTKRMGIGQSSRHCEHQSPMEIAFNYVGQHRDLQRQDGLFQLMNQMAGETGRGGAAADFGEETPRFALFEISAMAAQGKLRFSFSFSRLIKHQNLIRDWISCCHEILEHVGPRLQSLSPRPTLSDFPMLSLTYQELDGMFSKKLPSIGIDDMTMIEDIYPCTRMQEGILLSRLRDESFYAVQKKFEVRDQGGKPEINRLAAAWNMVVSRHPLLRTVFVEGLTTSSPFSQVVLKSFEENPEYVRCVNDDGVLAALDGMPLVRSHRNRPSHEFVICESASGKVFCKLEISHAAMDGYSISIILRDLQLAYKGKLTVEHTPMFKGFVQHIRRVPQPDSLEYWKKYLSNSQPCHFPVLNDGKGSPKKLQTLRLRLDMYDALKTGCEKTGFTLSTAFSVAWGLTLRSFCQSNDVCFSYMASLRDASVQDIDEIVGPVINLLICRMMIPQDALLRDVIFQVQHDYMEHLPHRNSSLIDIHHALKIHNTLFNTGLSYRKLSPSHTTANDGLQFVELGTIYDPSEFPVFINVEVTDDDGVVDFNYWTTALSDGQAVSISGTFLNHLESIISCQDETLPSMDGVSLCHTKQIKSCNKPQPGKIDVNSHEILTNKTLIQPTSHAVNTGDGNLAHPALDEPDYWKEYLADFEPCLFPSLQQVATPRILQSARLPIRGWMPMNNRHSRYEIDTASILRVAWGLVLRCYTGSEIVCFGYSHSDQGSMSRVLTEKDTTGSIVPFKLHLGGGMELQDVLNKSSTDLLQMMQHPASLDEILRKLPHNGGTPFNSILQYKQRSDKETANPCTMPIDIDMSNFILGVSAVTSDSLSEINFSYATDCFSADGIADIMECFANVLHFAMNTAHPSSHLSEFDFFTERSCRFMQEWNDDLPDRPTRCAHEFIQDQVSKLPRSTPAICAWDGNFTYADLDNLSSRLASHLQNLGVRPETFVALFFEKSAWAVVAQVAVLKSGGAFVCFDPTHPIDRLKTLVTDVGTRIALSSTKCLGIASSVCNVAISVSETTIHELGSPTLIAPAVLPCVTNTAYAVFTSGSTGKPKVTVLEHVALSGASSALGKEYQLSPDTRVINFSSYTFDVSIADTIIVLMHGGCVCVPSEEERLNDLAGAIRRMEANLIIACLSIMNTLDPKEVPSLRTLASGGEKMTESHVQRWADRCVINSYGPSEATIVATSNTIVDMDGRRLVENCGTIGTAICGRTWVVDPFNYDRLVPVGAVGELVLEGCNVARGYLGNEKKTKQVFIQDPLWTNKAGLQKLFRRKERMYCTGDLVRYNPDGSLCFITRKDTQIKLNGVRIELEEIEQQCISILPPGTEVAVDIIIPEVKMVAKSLAAFFTITEDSVGNTARGNDDVLNPQSDHFIRTVEKLASSLKTSLPPAFIPKLFVPMRRLPFTSSGKLDRRKLRSLIEPLNKEQLRAYSVVKTGTRKTTQGKKAETLKELWEATLGLEAGSVGDEDSFFGIGGDSFSAMKLVGAAGSRGISLRVSDIYAHPVFSDMLSNCQLEETTTRKQPAVKPFSLLPISSDHKKVLSEVSEQCSVQQESISDVYPCSPVQEGLIILSIKQPGAYIAQPVFRLRDGINLERFKASWQQVVDELDILRTRIIHTDSTKFLQVVLKEDRITWRATKTLGELATEGLKSSNHNGGPLTRYTIVKQNDLSTAYFVWDIHHALYDGWMLPIIFKRVEKIYYGTAIQNTSLPYKVFVRHLEDQDPSASDKFWKLHLSNVESNAFPSNKPCLPHLVKVGNRHFCNMAIPESLDKGGFTLPELIRAAWAIIVATHSGSSDVCFGETLMGRNADLPGIADVVGPVLTTVPTRIQVDNELLVTQFLQSVRDLSTAMLPHQHSGLQRIRKISKDASIASEFQNILVIQSDEVELDADLWVPEGNRNHGDFFAHPLTLECKIVSSRMEITAHHDEIILDSLTTERLIQQFTCVLDQLFALSKTDKRKVGDLEVCSPADRAQIASWNKRSPFCVERCVHDIIREKCSTQLKAPAVCAWDGQLSYEETYKLASSFAGYLASHGVGPETLIPLCMDKSVWAVVSILGILIAGGAFVPLDPSHPTSRHKEILEEIDARVILCSPQYHNRYAELVKTVIPVSKETIRAYGVIGKGSKGFIRVQPSNMAFAIFTSGSTGRPKGIIIDHKALVSSALAFGPIVHLKKDSRAFQFASLAFDAAVMEVLATLMHGGCICIPSEDERINDVAGAIQRMNVSWAFLTPSMASIIEPSNVPSLKVLVCGGEKLSREVMTKWAHRVQLVNGYGPTETTIFAVLNDVSANLESETIGHGLPCTLTWVVNPENHHQLTPLGVVGELALEGPALAREYIKNPKKTADAFINEPAWMKRFPRPNESPRRIYKTGDLVKYNPDGSIGYIGRKDHQVKLHGQRMELGEIEHRLYEDSRIRHAVVILPKSGLLQERLVAILSLDSVTMDKGILSDGACELVGQDMMALAHSELTDIQRNMEVQLPIYMVPQTWAVIKTLPMLVSGKLDRKRITSWAENIDESTYDRIMQDYDSVKPGNPEPQKGNNEGTVIEFLCDIVAQVLNIPSPKVDVSRSFVSLGGDSITGMALISKARKYGLSLTLHNVLQSKSIRDLASNSSTSIHTLKDREVLEEPFSPSPIQKLYLQTANNFSGSNRFNQGIRVRLTRPIKPDVINRAIRAIVDRHSMFRARFSKSKAKGWHQRILKDAVSSYRFRVHVLENQHDIFVKTAESQHSLDIQNGPVLAVDLFNTHRNGQILVLVASHLCVDMVSWRIVLQDLEDFVETGSISLDKSLSFQSWCELQTKHASENDEIRLPFSVNPPDIKYWGIETCANAYGHAKMETFTIDKDATAFILGQCHEVFRTETVDVLLCAVIESFCKVFDDREPPTMYNEGHGREVWDSSLDLSRTVGIVETLKCVKDMRRNIASHTRSYFAQKLLRGTKSRDWADFPIPVEILFNFLGKLQQLEGANSLFQHSGDMFSSEAFELSGDMGSETPRFALFEISAIVVAEQIHVSFTYNRYMHHESRIRMWMTMCKQILEKDVLILRDLIPKPTLSDYPLLPITYAGLNKMMSVTLPRAGIESWQSIEDIYPCSSVQEGILLSQLRDPHSYMFHAILEVHSLDKTSRVNAEKLRKAWTMILERHPAMRTLFIESHSKGGSFDQLVLKVQDDDVVGFECDDRIALETLDNIKLADINDKRLLKLPQQLSICSTACGRVLVKIEINHAIIDGASIEIILQDLMLAYNDQLVGSGPLFSEYIKVKFASRKTLSDISREVQHDYMGGLQHQNCSLAQIQHDLGHEGQTLFNTVLSIQNHSVAEQPKDKSISFTIQQAHDPTEYPVTVNVETAKGQEGILIRYWTDVVSEGQVQSMADAIAHVFNCFIETPSKFVADLSLGDQPAKVPSRGTNNSLISDIQEEYLRDMVDRRVKEVISQMIKNGALAIPTTKEKTKRRSKVPQIEPSHIIFNEKETTHDPASSGSLLTLADYPKESNYLEKRLWKLWRAALGLSSDSYQHKVNFFKSGGDSISAMKMVGAAREEGLMLSVADVFKHPVFEDMVAAVCAREGSDTCTTDPSKSSSVDRFSGSSVLISRSISPEEITLMRPIEPLDDASLQAGICPKIGVFRGGIADVLPLTDFQAMSITGSLFKSRWMLNYFYLDGAGSLDTRRLRESFLRVVDAFDILRTVFVCFHGQFFQVILRKMRPEIFVHETEKSLDEYTESLQQRDRKQDPRQGEQYVQFYIVKQKGTDFHRILIRMSHAQYDGVCLPRIMTAIKMGYEGSTIPPAPSFANYMRMIPGTITPEHYQHWKALLHGSKMTEIVRRHTANSFQHIGAYEQLARTIEIPATALGNITIATVMQSAWAMTLAKLSAQSDVVFGLTITGRNATVPGIESIVGPCLNIIPVRVKFGDRWTGLDLFRYLQDQQVSNMAFESLGFREIFRQCTDWPGSTYFTTTVFHQNVDYQGKMQLDNRTHQMGGAGVVDNLADLTLFSKQSNEQSLHISLGFSRKSPFQPCYISKVLDMVCETVQSLITNPSITLPSPNTLRSLPNQLVDDIPRPSDAHFLSSNMNSRSISEILVHSDMVSQIWNDVLPNKTPDGPRPPFQLTSSFFDLGGDICNMAQVVWLLEQEGMKVRLEDLLEHPTFLGQMAVLALHNSAQESQAQAPPSDSLPTAPSEVKSGTWSPLDKAMVLARRISKWHMASKS